LDEAVATFGNALSDELESVEGKTKSEIEMKSRQILDLWLTPPVSGEGEDGEAVRTAPRGVFRDPAERFGG
jgi:hypothetical protein